MPPSRIAVAAIAPLLLAAPDAWSVELQQPLPLYTSGLSADPSPDATSPPGASSTCAPLPPVTGQVQPGRLVIRDTDRPDVGPYTVKLPGYGTGTGGATDQHFYRPFLATASPGDALRFDIVNQLEPGMGHGGHGGHAGNTTNLHTHGLIVSPRPCTPLGDYIFVEDQPGTTTSHRIDIPATLPGYMFGSQATPRPYPSGLSWFHAHLHMQAESELLAGQSGILYVGDVRADLLAAPNLDPATADALDRTDVLYMGLRDIQLAVPRGATPNRAAPGQRANWLHGEDYDSSACLSQANPPSPRPGGFAGFGYCGHRGVRTGGNTNSQQDTVWLFTVNGQHAPDVTMQPGRNQVWRVVNLSPDVTYVLELADDATGQVQAMTALAYDGVTAGTSAPGDNALRVGISQSRFLLTPGNRVELFVANEGGPAGRRLTLRTIGLNTGASGDPWPRIDLARVAMPPGPNAGSLAGLNVTLPLAAPTSAVPASLPASAAVPDNCTTLPSGRTTRRRITFTNDATGKEFLLGSEVVDVYGRVLDTRQTIPPEPFPMQASTAPNTIPHVCPRLGELEVWEIINASGEMHNFHIHQNKFRLTVAGDPGAPPDLQAYQDPAFIVAPYLPETQGAPSGMKVNAWRDVLALPPYGGRAFVTIPFYVPEQVGDFVYHCHILGHEDRGMMAVVQVYDPSR